VVPFLLLIMNHTLEHSIKKTKQEPNFFYGNAYFSLFSLDLIHNRISLYQKREVVFLKRKIVLNILLVVVLLMVTACGSASNNNNSASNAPKETNSNTAKEEPKKSDEAIELRMTWWGGQERHDRTLEVIEMYEAQNPNVTIVAEYSGFDGYFDKLTTQFAAGNAPDIIQYGGNLNDFVGRNVVLPLDEFVGDELDVSKHDQSMLDAATFDGKLYGVTLGSNAWGVLVNKTVFEEANVPLPSQDWTWEDFEKTAAQITEATNKKIYGAADFEENGFGIFLAQRGKLIHENGVLGFNAQDVQDWFQMWDNFRKSGAAAIPEVQASASQTPEQSLIVRRAVAMESVASNQYGAYNNATEDDLLLYLSPYNSETGKNGISLRPSQFLSGYSETKHPEEVAKFLSFFTNNLEATAVLGNDRGAPVNSEVRDNLIANASEVDEVIFSYIQKVSQTSDAPYVPNLPGYNETQALFKRASEKIAFGSATVEAATKEYWTEVEKVMEKYSAE
jgi:multiple sugar transport system substrate-binding protein